MTEPDIDKDPDEEPLKVTIVQDKPKPEKNYTEEIDQEDMFDNTEQREEDFK